MDMQIKKYAKEYAKDKAFAWRLSINIIGIVVMVILIVSYAIAKTGNEPTELASMNEESLDNTYVLDNGQEAAGSYEMDISGYKEETGSYEENVSNYEENAGDYEAVVSGYKGDAENCEEETVSYEGNVDGYEESIDNEEDLENYRESIEDFLHYSYEGDVDDLLKCAGMYTHAKISDITLKISIYSDSSGNEIGTFEISDTKCTYSGVINIGEETGKYKMRFEDGDQYTMSFYTDGTDYYIYIHSIQYIYGYAESGLFVLIENYES